MNHEDKHISERLQRELLLCRDILNSAVSQLVPPAPSSRRAIELELDNDATAHGAD